LRAATRRQRVPLRRLQWCRRWPARSASHASAMRRRRAITPASTAGGTFSEYSRSLPIGFELAHRRRVLARRDRAPPPGKRPPAAAGGGGVVQRTALRRGRREALARRAAEAAQGADRGEGGGLPRAVSVPCRRQVRATRPRRRTRWSASCGARCRGSGCPPTARRAGVEPSYSTSAPGAALWYCPPLLGILGAFSEPSCRRGIATLLLSAALPGATVVMVRRGGAGRPARPRHAHRMPIARP